MRRAGWGLTASIVAVALWVGPVAAQVPAGAPAPPGITAAAAVLVSLSDGEGQAAGRVLFGRSVHGSRPPASLTKMVTALVARDEYGLDEIVTVSPLVLQVHGSSLGLRPGMQFPVRELLYALLLKSGNDVGMALAAHHPMGYEYFIQLMNAKARSLGAHDTRMRNPHGLDMPGHVSSAWDMALFGRQVLADPLLAEIVSTHRYTMAWTDGETRSFDNHNKMLKRYEGTIGLKTGFTRLAGHSLAAAARTEFGRVITIVLGSQDHYADTAALLDYGKAVEFAQASGGGAVEGGQQLNGPPARPPEDLPLAVSAVAGTDPRDDVRWLALMGALAAAAALSLGYRRRSHPLSEAAEVHGWLETLVPPTERSAPRRR